MLEPEGNFRQAAAMLLRTPLCLSYSILVGSAVCFSTGCSQGDADPDAAAPVAADDDSSGDDDAGTSNTSDDDDAADDDAIDDTDDDSDDDDAPRSVATCLPGDPSAFLAPQPMPVISVDKPVAASEGVIEPERAVDGNYGTPLAQFGEPSSDEPAWLAIDLGKGPSRIIAIWHDSTSAAYNTVTSGTPYEYRLETSADSTDGNNGEWTVAADIDKTTVRTRGHSIDFEGQRWLRMVLTAPRPDELDNNIRIDELVVHDASHSEPGYEDSWLFFGDSIGQAAFSRDTSEASRFDAKVAELSSSHFPATINASVAAETLISALKRLDDALELNSAFRYFGIAYGTNDAWGNKNVTSVRFEEKLREVVDRVLAAGHVPVLARIPFSSGRQHDTLASFNAVIDSLQAEYELPCGPDLYNLFRDAPNGLGADGVHPTPNGNKWMNQAWAEVAAGHYEADDAAGDVAPSTAGDAGLNDAGVNIDGGAPDAGNTELSDASSSDAASASDAGPLDASAE